MLRKLQSELPSNPGWLTTTRTLHHQNLKKQPKKCSLTFGYSHTQRIKSYYLKSPSKKPPICIKTVGQTSRNRKNSTTNVHEARKQKPTKVLLPRLKSAPQRLPIPSNPQTLNSPRLHLSPNSPLPHRLLLHTTDSQNLDTQTLTQAHSASEVIRLSD